LLRMINAGIEDLDRIEQLYNDCINELNRRGIFQWDYRYPNTEFYISSINNKDQYIFLDDEILVGSVVLNETQSDEWSTVSWNYEDEETLVIHALAINPKHQGKGYGQKVLDLCHEYAIENNYKVIRLDVFTENPTALHLYEKNGYKRVGAVTFDIKPEGHQLYYCYEKLL
jgi:ribosomal protein S18 acetylase RimI-like enzyme